MELSHGNRILETIEEVSTSLQVLKKVLGNCSTLNVGVLHLNMTLILPLKMVSFWLVELVSKAAEASNVHIQVYS